MIGLKIAGVCLVLFVTGCVFHCATKEDRPGYRIPSFISWLGVFGMIGIPLGLILAILGV